MIIFKSIRMKNFLSVGNIPIKMSLDSHKRTLITGDNGTGKSIILDAVCFVLFGKAYRNINKGNLINSINTKDCLIECEFSIGPKEYKIIRGMKPNVFEIYESNTLINQDSNSRDYQKYLEKNILGLNFKSFTQIVILGSANYQPFMKLTAADRREVIEDLLDIQIFSTMNDVLKTKTAELLNKIHDYSENIRFINIQIDTEKKHIQELKEKDNNNIQTIHNLIEKQKEKALEIDKKIKNTQNDMADISNVIQGIVEPDKAFYDTVVYNKYKLEHQIQVTEKTSKLLETNSECPYCEQSISEEYKKIWCDNNETYINEMKQALQVAFQKINEYDNEKTTWKKHNDKLSVLNQQLKEQTNELQKIKDYVIELYEQIKNTKKNTNNKANESKLNDLIRDVDVQNTELTKLKEQHKRYDLIKDLLKDKGIKATIIRNYLPLMNSLINKYLKALDFFVGFYLDSEFKETIKSRHRDEFSYNSFSEGQKFRINISILLTWREIAKKKNSISTNLLILDEVFDSSLDSSGMIEFTKLLNIISNDNTNIFVMSHRGDQILDQFDRILEYKMIKNFTSIKEME